MERNLTPGEDFYVTDLDTARGPVRVGAMICYDREFPESARLLMLKGAELILTPNACPMELNRLSQLRARAFAEGSRDTCLLQAGGEEGVCVAGLDLDMLRAYRGREVHGNAYRHPKKYALLTDTRIDEPFIRANRRE